MPTSSRLLTFLSLSSFTLLTACGGDAERGDARFADMSAAERTTAIGHAAGGAGVTPYFLVFMAEIDNASNPDCPRREDGDGVVTFTADDCQTTTGARHDGRLVARNVPMFGDVLGGDNGADPDKPMSIEMDGWQSGENVFDGVLTQSTPWPEDEAYTSDFAYHVTGAGGGTFAAAIACDAVADGGMCAMDGAVDLGALGSFVFDGELAYRDGDASGGIELRGADTLVVDLDAAVDGCAPYTIDGEAAGTWCFASPEPEPASIEITGAGGGCASDGAGFEWQYDTWTKGEVARVTVTIVELGEEHELAFLSHDAELDEDWYQVIFGDADTAMTCGDEVTLRFTAYGSDGSSVSTDL